MNNNARSVKTDQLVSLNHESPLDATVLARAASASNAAASTATTIVPDDYGWGGGWLIPWGSNLVGGILSCCPGALVEGDRRRPRKWDCRGKKMWWTPGCRDGRRSQLRLGYKKLSSSWRGYMLRTCAASTRGRSAAVHCISVGTQYIWKRQSC